MRRFSQAHLDRMATEHERATAALHATPMGTKARSDAMAHWRHTGEQLRQAWG